MKTFLNYKSSFLIIIGLCLAHHINSQHNHLLVYEKNMSPIASAENILTARQGFINYENQFLPNKIEGASKLVNVGYRLFKTGTVNFFLDNSAKLLQHEAFGHGYRQREFGYTRNSINLRIFFFGFSGFSRLGMPTPGRIFTDQERTMWFSGGAEATSILSETILSHWSRSEEILLSDTYLYLSSLQFGTLLATNYEDDLTSDAELYLKRINNHYGFVGIDNYQLTLDKIRKQAAVDLLNPYIFYSLYSFSKDYLWEGKEKTKLPMLKIGNLKYMPYMKFWLTPYGSEFQLNNILKTQNRLFRYHIRLGDNTFDSSSWGTGLTIENLFQNNWFKFSADVNIWNQPSLELGDIGTTIIKEKGLGGAIRLYAYFKFVTGENLKNSTDIFLNVGYKTKGYLQGETLADNIIWRFGLNFSY